MADYVVSFGCGFLLVGVVLDIISVATSDWMSFSDGSMSGLWKECATNGRCVSVKSTDRMDGVRAMMVTSVLVSGIALVVVVVDIAYVCTKKIARKWVKIFAAGFAFFAVLLALIGILVYHRHIWTETASLVQDLGHGYSFWLGVAAIVLFFLAGLFFLDSAARCCRSPKNEHKHNVYEKDIFTIQNDKSKPKYMDNDSNDLENDKLKSGLHPFKYDYMYYATVPVSSGIYSYGDPSVIKSLSRADSYGSDFRIPRVWIA